MDCPVFAQYQPALSRFSVQNQHRILRYLAGLAARQYADTTLSAVVTTLNVLLRHLPGRRQVVLTDDITQTTTQDITDFITGAQSAGLAPTTINTKLSILTSFFEHLREEGQMTHQPVLRRRHRLLTPTVLPKPMPDTDLIAFFQVIDSVRDRLIFLLMLRCGLRVSEVCALAWDAIDLQRWHGAHHPWQRAGGSDRVPLARCDAGLTGLAASPYARQVSLSQSDADKGPPLPLPNQCADGSVSRSRRSDQTLFSSLSSPYFCDATAQCGRAP